MTGSGADSGLDWALEQNLGETLKQIQDWTGMKQTLDRTGMKQFLDRTGMEQTLGRAREQTLDWTGLG